MKRLMVTALILMFIASASATQIQVQPQQYSFEAIAGDSHTQQLQVTWNGDNPTALTAETSIQAENTDDEGFNIGYSDNPVAFLPGETRTVDVNIDTSEALIADNYTFNTEFSTSVTVDDDESDTHYSYTTTVEGDLNKSKEEELQEEVNETVDENLELRKELEALRERLEDLNTSEQEQPVVNETEGNQSSNETSQVKPDGQDKGKGLIEVFVDMLFGWLG